MTPAQAKKFDFFEHTADIGLTAYGSSMKELFENAACGMFSCLSDLTRIKPEVKMPVVVEGPKEDNESLLVNFLNELLYLHAVKKIIFSVFDITEFGKNYIKANVSGMGGIKPNREIKAATSHNLKIQSIPAGYRVKIILDI